MKPESLNAIKEELAYVEFDEDNRPFSVITKVTHKSYDGCVYMGYDYYDFDYSKDTGWLHYHLSGCGGVEPIGTGKLVSGTVVYWAAKGVDVIEEGLCRRLRKLPKPYNVDNMFEEGASSEKVIYCTECQDNLRIDYTDYPCEHIWWCDKCDWWSTPEERCDHEKPTDEWS